MQVKLSDLVDAFDWVSVTGPFENTGYISLATGKIWLITDFDDDEVETPPDDIHDETLYLPVPHKNELDLGRTLALRFVEQHLPAKLDTARGYFRGPGAYAKFKAMLDAGDHLEAWYAFEAKGTEDAVREWAKRNDIAILETPPGPV